MKKLYTLAFVLSAAFSVQAQAPVDIADMGSISTIELSEYRNHGLLKAQPISLPSVQAPLTFDAYYNRKTAWDVPVFTISGNPFLATYSHGLPGKIGVNFDNSATVNIDRLLVNIFAKADGTVNQWFYGYIYNRNASDSLPTGSPLGTVQFDIHTPRGAIYPAIDSVSYTVLTFPSPVTVSGPFVAAIQIDNAVSGTRDRIGLGTNKCLSPGNGNSEKRMSVYPVPGASGVSQQWYKFNDFFNTALSTTSLNWNCEAMIIPLVVGESSPLGVNDGVKASVNGLVLNGHYPNPAVENLKINYTTEKYNNVVNIRVFDITGRTIYETNHIQQAAGKNVFDINLADFASGEYFYTIKSDDSSISSHFMVIK